MDECNLKIAERSAYCVGHRGESVVCNELCGYSIVGLGHLQISVHIYMFHTYKALGVVFWAQMSLKLHH